MRALFSGRRAEAEEKPALSDRSTVQVRVIEARGLAPMDTGALFGVGAADPYVVLQLGDQMRKTKRQKGTLEPVWEQEFDFHGIPETHTLVATCFDWDRFTSDDPMGQVVVPTLEMTGVPQWYTLQPMPGCDKPQGEIRMACNAVFPPDSAAAIKVRMHRKRRQAAQALALGKQEAAAAADDGSVQPTDRKLQVPSEPEGAQSLAEENAEREEEEARLAEEAAQREMDEAAAAQAEAQVQQEEAQRAEEKKLAEERDVREAEKRLEAAIAGGSEAEIEAARANLAREKAEAEAAAADAAREAKEATQAAAFAVEQQNEADAARELAAKERAEANAAAVAAALHQLGDEKTAQADNRGDGLSRASEVGGGYNDNGDRVHRGRKSGGGTRPFSAPHEFKYYCGKAMPGGPLEATQLAFKEAEAEHKKRYLEERERVLRSDAGKAAGGNEELIEPSQEPVVVGSKTVVVDGGVGVSDPVPDGVTVVVDESQGILTIHTSGGVKQEFNVTVLVNPLKKLTVLETRRRREAAAKYKKKMEVLRMEAVREWKKQAPGAKTVPGLNGLCGPYDGEQCPSCWRYQQALLRHESHTNWRDTPAGRTTLGQERKVLQQAYCAQRLEPSQSPQEVIRQRRSRFDERAAFALHRRAFSIRRGTPHRDQKVQLQAVADELLQLSGRVQKLSSDSLSGYVQNGYGDGLIWKARWMQLIELPQGREHDGKRHKFGKPHQRPKPRFALEYRQHSNSPRALGTVPLDVPSGESIAGVRGLYKLILRAGPRGDRLLDLHASHIPCDAVAYAPLDGFVICGARDEATCKRKLWVFMSTSSQVADIERARRWYRGLVKLKRHEDPQSVEMEERAEKELAMQEQAKADRNSAEAAYGADGFEEGSDDEQGSSASSVASSENMRVEAQKRADGPTYHLSVTVTECRNLTSADTFGKNDPYVSCYLDTYFAPIAKHEFGDDDRRARHRTTTCENGGANPVWGGQGGGGTSAFAQRGETMCWDLKKPGAELFVEVWDEDAGDKDDLIGKVQIPLDPSGEFGSGPEEAELEERWYALQPPSAGAGAGEVRVSLNCWREAGVAKGVGWDRARHIRTRVKIAAHVGITTAPEKREQDRLDRIARGAEVRRELQEAVAMQEQKQREIEDAIAHARAAAGVEVDPMGKEKGHPSFYQPPPRTLYTAQGYVKDARNNNQGADIFEGGTAAATGRHIRYANGELRLMLDAHLEQKLMTRGATMWNSTAAGSSTSNKVRDKRLGRINRGLVRIPDPYPED